MQEGMDSSTYRSCRSFRSLALHSASSTIRRFLCDFVVMLGANRLMTSGKPLSMIEIEWRNDWSNSASSIVNRRDLISYLKLTQIKQYSLNFHSKLLQQLKMYFLSHDLPRIQVILLNLTRRKRHDTYSYNYNELMFQRSKQKNLCYQKHQDQAFTCKNSKYQ